MLYACLFKRICPELTSNTLHFFVQQFKTKVFRAWLLIILFDWSAVVPIEKYVKSDGRLSAKWRWTPHVEVSVALSASESVPGEQLIHDDGLDVTY